MAVELINTPVSRVGFSPLKKDTPNTETPTHLIKAGEGAKTDGDCNPLLYVMLAANAMIDQLQNVQKSVTEVMDILSTNMTLVQKQWMTKLDADNQAIQKETGQYDTGGDSGAAAKNDGVQGQITEDTNVYQKDQTSMSQALSPVQTGVSTMQGFMQQTATNQSTELNQDSKVADATGFINSLLQKSY